MPLTPDNLKSLNNWKEYSKHEAERCNIKGTLFAFSELIKKGQELLQGKHPADTFVVIKKVYDSTNDDVISALKRTCGCKGESDLIE
jgi:hypothetical protein